jgi:hypothetical protein
MGCYFLCNRLEVFVPPLPGFQTEWKLLPGRQCLQQIADGDIVLKIAPKGQGRINRIGILPAMLSLADVAVFLELLDDPSHCALSHADVHSNLLGGQLTVMPDA